MFTISMICASMALTMAVPIEQPRGFAIRTEHRILHPHSHHVAKEEQWRGVWIENKEHEEQGFEQEQEIRGNERGISGRSEKIIVKEQDADKDYHSYPMYKFEYGVKDMHTGDHKMQWEERHGDVVKGAYMLDEADGTQRIVEYKADDKDGFRAVVKKIGKAHEDILYHKIEEHHVEKPKTVESGHKYKKTAHSYSNLKKMN